MDEDLIHIIALKENEIFDLKKENERYKDRLRNVWSIVQASEGLQQNNKVAKLILEEVFPHPNVK